MLRRSRFVAVFLITCLSLNKNDLFAAEKKTARRDIAAKERADSKSSSISTAVISNFPVSTDMQSEALKKQKNLRIWSQPKLPKEAVDQKSFAQWSLLVEDRTLYQALGRWSAVAGWQLIWDADRDFPVESNVHLTQTFLGAIEIVLETLKDTDYPLQAAVNTETRVVRIIRHLDQSN